MGRDGSRSINQHNPPEPRSDGSARAARPCAARRSAQSRRERAGRRAHPQGPGPDHPACRGNALVGVRYRRRGGHRPGRRPRLPPDRLSRRDLRDDGVRLSSADCRRSASDDRAVGERPLHRLHAGGRPGPPGRPYHLRWCHRRRGPPGDGRDLRTVAPVSTLAGHDGLGGFRAGHRLAVRRHMADLPPGGGHRGRDRSGRPTAEQDPDPVLLPARDRGDDRDPGRGRGLFLLRSGPDDAGGHRHRHVARGHDDRRRDAGRRDGLHAHRGDPAGRGVVPHRRHRRGHPGRAPGRRIDRRPNRTACRCHPNLHRP